MASCASRCRASPPPAGRIEGGRDSVRLHGHQLLHARPPALHPQAALPPVPVPGHPQPRPDRHRLGGLPRGLLPAPGGAAAQYGLPIWVTENGIDDRAGRPAAPVPLQPLEPDAQRRAARAPTCAATSTGRCWTTSSGSRAGGPRFGLYRVDFETLERRAHARVPLLPPGGPERGARGAGDGARADEVRGVRAGHGALDRRPLGSNWEALRRLTPGEGLGGQVTAPRPGRYNG